MLRWAFFWLYIRMSVYDYLKCVSINSGMVYPGVIFMRHARPYQWNWKGEVYRSTDGDIWLQDCLMVLQIYIKS